MARQRWNVRRARTPVVIGLTALAIAVGGLGVGPAVAADIEVPLPTFPRAPEIKAAAGSSLIVDQEPGRTPKYQVSRDSGGTWEDLDAPEFASGYVSYADVDQVVYVVEDGDSPARVYRYRIEDNTTAPPVEINQDDLATAGPTHAIYRTKNDDSETVGFTSVRLDDPAVSAQLDWAPRSDNEDSRVQIAAAGTAMVSSYSWADDGSRSVGHLDLVPLDGGARLRTVAVPNLAAAVVRAGDAAGTYSQAVYVTLTSSAANICFRSLASDSAVATCRKLKSGNFRTGWVGLNAGQGWAMMTLVDSNDAISRLVVSGSTGPGPVVTIKRPSGAHAVEGLVDLGPALAAATAAYVKVFRSIGDYVGTVDLKTGKVTSRLRSSVHVTTEGLGVSGTRLTGLDTRGSGTRGDQLWSRSLSSPNVEKLLSPRADQLAVSGGRALTDGPAGLVPLDGDKAGARLDFSGSTKVSTLSGPYVLGTRADGWTEVRRVDGWRSRTTGDYAALFGELAVERSQVGGETAYSVVDVNRPGTRYDVVVPPGMKLEVKDIALDWVFGETEGNEAVAINYKSGAVYRHAGAMLDGANRFALLDVDHELVVWKFLSDETQTFPDWDRGPVATDGWSRVAYATATKLVVADVAVAPDPRYGPRVLGTIASPTFYNAPASARWRLEIDASEALGAGTIQFVDGAENVVRELSVPASADGAIRLTWDGRGVDRKPVPPGTYSWRLAMPPAVGTRNLSTVDGSFDIEEPDRVSGTLEITRGKVTAGKPTITGTARFGETLTAKPGTWKPSGSVTPSYQWFRGSTPIDDATGATYQVTADDIGAKLKVRVTGDAAGYDSASVFSKVTAAVAKGRLTAPVPTLDTGNNPPKVGQEIVATAGTWGPDPVDPPSYQWYRVSAKKKSTAISGADQAAYTVDKKDVGYRLMVKVTGAKENYATTSVSSAQTSFVVKGSLVLQTMPIITVEDDSPRVGKTLTAQRGTYLPAATATPRYQWYRVKDGKTTTIAGATSSTYVAATADIGAQLGVRVTSGRDGYTSDTREYRHVVPVGEGLKGVVPVLTLTKPRIGEVIEITDTSDASRWTPQQADIRFTYQWYRGSTPIPDGTEPTHLVTPDDGGFALRVKVTGEATHYASVTKTSVATWVVPK